METPDLHCPATGTPCLGRQKAVELTDRIAALQLELTLNDLLGDPDRPNAHNTLLDEWTQRANAIKHALATTACDGSSCQPYQAAALQHKFDSPPHNAMRPPLE